MTKCPACQRDTSPVNIGGQMYCGDCGTPVHLELRAAPPAPPRHSFDLTSRRRTNVDRPEITEAPAPKSQTRSGEPAEVQLVAGPKGAEAKPHHGKPAAAMHGRVKPSRVLDLRTEAPAEPAHHPHHDMPAAPPKSTAHERHLAHFTDRFDRARRFERSPHINKFSTGRLATPDPATHHQPVGQQMHAAPRQVEPAREMPHLTATQHQAMARLAPQAPRQAPAPAATARPTGTGWRPHLGLSARGSQTLATIAAIALMGGYIWLQNYPKLALQSANTQAGINATLPSYLPTSYNLKNTTVNPGLITLSFFSPSSSEPLTIAQNRTSWDSSSLLDNFVAQRADDYSTVQGQGLTIFLYNNNQAAWVNHGIRYTIEGAGRLSREQVLKIAYSL